MNQNETEMWLSLKSVQGLGPVLIKRLIEVFGSPKGVLGADIRNLMDLEGIGESLAGAILSCGVTDTVKREVDEVNRLGIGLVSLTDSEYPSLLREIHDPPSLLYVRGKLHSEKPAIAIVGSRRATAYGRSTTDRFSRCLTEEGFLVVSGMARGIDGFAHRAALHAGGETLAVLGCGVNRVYPPEHRDLMTKIMDQGGVLSEYSLETEPDAKNFPQRNRIISGVSLGTLVIEATAESGSLITARLSLEQGREVFAIPGNLGVKTSEGTNHLIKSGAKLVQGMDDILEEIVPQFRKVAKQHFGKSTLKSIKSHFKQEDLPVDESILFDLVGVDPVHIDELSSKSHFPSQKVSSLLLSMELKGAIQQMAGQFYTRSI
ncbi:MAG TPA: DNA-processing protein DprA [Nitrospiria bacterium]|jgi:DNA processing protein